ncbi:unnamed protein product [Leuciscus chuanchicus]
MAKRPLSRNQLSQSQYDRYCPLKSLQEESGVLSSSADPCSDHIHMTFDLCPGRAPTVPSVSRPHDIIPQHRPALGEGVQTELGVVLLNSLLSFRAPLSYGDRHVICVSCLGEDHAALALADGGCPHCELLPMVTLRTRLASFSETAHPPAARPPSAAASVEDADEEAASGEDDTCSILASGSEDWASSVDLAPAAREPSGKRASIEAELMRVLLAQAVASLGLEWSTPEQPAHNRLDGFFHLPKLATRRHRTEIYGSAIYGSAFLDAPLSSAGLFGTSVKDFVERFAEVQKASQAMKHFLLKRSSSAAGRAKPSARSSQPQPPPTAATSQRRQAQSSRPRSRSTSRRPPSAWATA